MRGLRSFAGLLAILIGLGAYLYFVESKRTPGDDAEKKATVFAVEPGKIDEITIKSESGDTTTLKKSGADWQIIAPSAAAADAAEISGITTNFSTLEQQRMIEENPADLKEFGLAEPRVEIGFKADGQEQKLLIGGKTPAGSDLYAKTAAAPGVFLIASYLDSTFNRTTFDLRDKAALKFDREAADALAIATADGTLELAKSNGEWRITQPAVARPDVPAIESLVARLNSLQMKGLAEAESADLATFGLDKPAATVQIGSGSARATLMVGAPADEGNVYARDASRPEVFTVEATLLDDLKKGADEYRQKDLFDARAFNATRVEVTRGGRTLVFEKTQGKDKDGKDEEKWRQTAPEAKDVDHAKIDALLSTLTSARADAFVAQAPAAAKPEAVFTLKFDEGRNEERVSFLRAGAGVYAVRDGAAATIAATLLDEILEALDGL